MMKKDLDVGVYYVYLYTTNNRRIASLKPIYFYSDTGVKEVLFDLYNNIISSLSYLDLENDLIDNTFKITISKDLFNL